MAPGRPERPLTRKQHTIIVVPHSRARFRQFQVTSRLIWSVAIGVSLSLLLGVVFGVLQGTATVAAYAVVGTAVVAYHGVRLGALGVGYVVGAAGNALGLAPPSPEEAAALQRQEEAHRAETRRLELAEERRRAEPPPSPALTQVKGGPPPSCLCLSRRSDSVRGHGAKEAQRE